MSQEPRYSPDGRHWWDGTTWQPVAQPPPRAGLGAAGWGLLIALVVILGMVALSELHLR